MEKEFNCYWGIDVSKRWLDISTGKQVFRIEQTPEAIETFIKEQRESDLLAVLESTGGYEMRVARRLEAAGISVHIAHPNKVKAFAKAKGRLAKTDKLDAHLLRDYGRFIEVDELRGLVSELQYKLHLLGARLSQLKGMHHQESCRLGMATQAKVKDSIQQMLSMMKQQIVAIEEEIMLLIKGDASLKERYQLLRSMKGVGPVLAMSLITDLPELGKVNKKVIAALVGVAPMTKESGQKRGKAVTRYGRPDVRKILYMGALTASKHHTRLKEFYKKLIALGKPKKVAIVAVMRKMIVILNAMIQSKSYYTS